MTVFATVNAMSEFDDIANTALDTSSSILLRIIADFMKLNSIVYSLVYFLGQYSLYRHTSSRYLRQVLNISLLVREYYSSEIS